MVLILEYIWFSVGHERKYARIFKIRRRLTPSDFGGHFAGTIRCDGVWQGDNRTRHHELCQSIL